MIFYSTDGALRNLAITLLLAIVIFSGCSKEKSNKESEDAPLPGQDIDLLMLISIEMKGWQEEETVLISETKDMP